ncbi:MAG: enoyl-CoA hydratase/isomerase family protein [Bacteroidia bacterium]|nr:enoyl-CoA hydratase/isomerase family protein [Bacteroidia bacterium]NNJ56825.1 2-(1,2-epoxy-1,2-dihydrophenyl)acetyl-CoA isomerase [Bacteroidia bacterium]
MNYNTLKYHTESGITTISLNRPDRYNAFNFEMSKELQDALAVAREDENCRVVVFTGEGKAFCSGQDLKDIVGTDKGFAEIVYECYNPIVKAMRSMPKPIICRLNGIAAGAGCSLVLASDYTVASDSANLIEVFINVGLVLDSGSSFFLPRVVGTNKAFELATMGSKVTAQQAVDLGMINKAVPSELLDEEVHKVAAYYASAPTKAIGMIKEMLNKSTYSTLDDMLELEAKYQEIAGNSDDYKEGLAAFSEKRKPNFSGS